MDSVINPGKIVIIGAGFVGATIGYTIMLNNLASEIVLLDVNQNKARGEALDMNHGIAYHKQLTIRDGSYEDCADAKLIIIAAGVNRKPGQTRLDLAHINVSIGKDIARNIMKYATNPIILAVSNPVDILTYVLQKETGLPASRVLGTGTTLDTARFRYLLSRHCEIDIRNVHAYIVGEHGDSEVPIWSKANIAGKPIDDFCADCKKSCKKHNRQKIFEDTKASGAEIISLKGATFYGIAMATARIVSAIMFDEHSVLTLSSVVNGDYGVNDVALSLPCVIDTNGINRILDIHISKDESQMLLNSAERLRDVLKQVYVKE